MKTKETLIFPSKGERDRFLNRLAPQGIQVLRVYDTVSDTPGAVIQRWYCAELEHPTKPERMAAPVPAARVTRKTAPDVAVTLRKALAEVVDDPEAKIRPRVEPPEFREMRILAHRWVDLPGVPVTAFARHVRGILVADEEQVLTTADALAIACAKRPDLFASAEQVHRAWARRLPLSTIDRMDDRLSLLKARGF